MITKLSTSEEASYRFRGVFQLTYSFSKTPLINNGQRLEALPLTAKGFEPDTVPTSINWPEITKLFSWKYRVLFGRRTSFKSEAFL